MRRSPAVFLSLMLIAMLVSSADAQARRPAPTSAARAGNAAQGGAGPRTNFTLFGGVATGDELDMGVALQGSFRIQQSQWPVALRIDPYIALHSGDQGFGSNNVDVSFRVLGVAAQVEYEFTGAASRFNALQAAGSSLTPYVFGGLGIYNGSVDVDFDGPGFDNFSFGGDDTNLGISLGGGVRFGRRFSVEAAFKMIDEFDTIPILFGFRF